MSGASGALYQHRETDPDAIEQQPRTQGGMRGNNGLAHGGALPDPISEPVPSNEVYPVRTILTLQPEQGDPRSEDLLAVLTDLGEVAMVGFAHLLPFTADRMFAASTMWVVP